MQLNVTVGGASIAATAVLLHTNLVAHSSRRLL